MSTKGVKLGLLVFVLAACLLTSCYYTIFRYADAELCYQKAAKKVNVAPTYNGITGYITKSLVVGMNDQAVTNVLEKLGKITPSGTRQLNSDEYKIEKGYRLNICAHPLNNIDILVTYDYNNELIFVRIYEWP